MEIGRAERIRMERAHVHAWPALRSAVIDGWLWRASGGGSQRANSVSTIDFVGDDPEAAIDAVEARYRSEGMTPRFQVFNETEPPDLPARLRRRGYRESEGTLTLFRKPVESETRDVEQRDRAWDAWRGVYLGQITESRRAVNNRILDEIPQPAAFFAATLGGRVAATALCSVLDRCGVVECVATEHALRRQGAARNVMLTLETWAALQGCEMLGLQVVETNAAGLGLYQGLGYQAAARNVFWVR